MESLPRLRLIEEHSLPFLWAVLCSLLYIYCSKTTSFHPQSNGLVERFHRSLKTSLRARLADSDWFDHLPLVMLGLWTTPPDWVASRAVYRSSLCLPGEFLDSVYLPPRELLDRIQSALHGLTLPPPHHVAPPSTHVPAALASAERTPPFSLSLNSTVAPTEFSVTRTSCSPWRLVPSKILFPLIVKYFYLQGLDI